MYPWCWVRHATQRAAHLAGLERTLAWAIAKPIGKSDAQSATGTGRGKRAVQALMETTEDRASSCSGATTWRCGSWAATFGRSGDARPSWVNPASTSAGIDGDAS